MQLCNVVLSQPQADDMADIAAVLSRWHLVVLHKGRSGSFDDDDDDMNFKSAASIHGHGTMIISS